MAGRTIDIDLRNAVRTAVYSVPTSATKAQIIQQFKGQDISRSSLYSWVSRDMADRAAGIALELVDGPPPVDLPPSAVRPFPTSAKPGPLPPPLQTVGEMVDAATHALVPRVAGQDPGPIPFKEMIHRDLRTLDALEAISLGPDGKIRNVRLAGDVVDLRGKTLARAARLNETVQDLERQEAFMRGLLEVIGTEPPEIRDRIMGKLRAYSARAKMGAL